jgi:hypothetical protein
METVIGALVISSVIDYQNGKVLEAFNRVEKIFEREFDILTGKITSQPLSFGTVEKIGHTAMALFFIFYNINSN